MVDVTKVYYELPNDLHRRAKVAAAMEGRSLKDYLIAALTAAVDKTESAQQPAEPDQPEPDES